MAKALKDARESVTRLEALAGTTTASLEVVAQGAAEAGASVSLDGQVQGPVPANVSTRPGRHLVEVTKEGFHKWSKWVDLKVGAPQRLSVALKANVEAAKPAAPKPTAAKGGKVTVSATPVVAGAKVFVDGVAKGPAPWTGELPAGPHRVEVRAAGHSSTPRDVAVFMGKESMVAIRLTVAGAPAKPVDAPAAKPASKPQPKKAVAMPKPAAAKPEPAESPAASDAKPMADERTFWKAGLGFSGRYARAIDDADDKNLSKEEGSLSESTLGGGMLAETLSGRYFAVGVNVEVQSVKEDKGVDASSLVAASPTVRLRYPIAGATREIAEVYVLGRGGLTLHLFSKDFDDTVKAQAGFEMSPVGFGWNLLAAAGGMFAITEGFGVFAEFGWRHHHVTQGIKKAGLPTPEDVEHTYTLAHSENMLNAGFVLLY